MLFSRVGRRRVNLAYLIMLEEIEEDGVPVTRITMDQGKEFTAPRDEARELVDQVDHMVDNPVPPVQTTIITRRDEPSGPRVLREGGA